MNGTTDRARPRCMPAAARLAHGLAPALGLLATLSAASAWALPMASQGSVMVMAERSPDERELAANFALTARDALGGAVGRWHEPMGHGSAMRAHEREYAALTYTRLLRRWNLPHAQANLWFVGMLGAVRAHALPGTRTLWSPALLADYETTRIYFGAGIEPMRARGLRHDTVYARAGFSFYQAEYDEMQPWFILQAKRTRWGMDAKSELTPMLRVIHRRFFFELGGNDNGAQVNLMLSY